jgi:NitT/TauT family transport system permease protein
VPRPLRFSPPISKRPALTAGDAVIVLLIIALLYVGSRLAFHAPKVIAGPEISLSPWALPWYAVLSFGRMTVAYVLSLLFSLVYGYFAARRPSAQLLLMPLLDVLQSVPILSFLPVVLLSLSAVLPQSVAAELAAIVLIFTSQAWNLTFSFYQSMKTIPTELREAAAVFRLDPWLRFKTLELPFAAIGLIWNSMMSWSGGWFFLMASEIFNVGTRDFRLPGLGSYLQTAASTGDLRAVLLGVLTLVIIILALDQFVWRPILASADRFKVEMVEGDMPPTSWVLDVLSHSWLLASWKERVWSPLSEKIDTRMRLWFGGRIDCVEPAAASRPSPVVYAAIGVVVLAAAYGSIRAFGMLSTLSAGAWGQLGLGLAATAGRVVVSLVIALAWTVPLGVMIGTNRRLATILQPMVQTVASIPATALFPVMLLALLRMPAGLNIAAILLMLMGTQWYLLFNVIAGASAIPQDLRYTTSMLRLSTLDRWKTLILPALFPYIVTGAITASGGAWNASIVAEHVQFGGQTHAVLGIGSEIAQATAGGDYAMLLAGTLVLVITVVVINRLVWRTLYKIAEERYRLD